MELLNDIDSFKKYLVDCFQQPSMQQQHLSGAGATHYLEAKLKDYYNKKYALTFCNATTALHALCIAMDLNNTEILTSPINWGGSVAPFIFNKNRLRFTSFDPITLNLSLRDLPSAITKKTKAVLSVDFNGTPVDSKAIKDFCSQNNLIYISDCAQSMGSFLNDKPAGYYSDAIVLSFSPGKSFFAGEGGAIITDDVTIYEKLLWYSQHPSRQKTAFGLSNFNDYAPINGRMNPFSVFFLNEIFQLSLINLKSHQFKCFELLSQLQKENLIESTPHINAPSSSSFFNFSLQLRPLVKIEQLNEFLQNHNQSFIAVPVLPKIIPFDIIFRKQFRSKYSCSESLLKQYGNFRLNDRGKLIFVK